MDWVTLALVANVVVMLVVFAQAGYLFMQVRAALREAAKTSMPIALINRIFFHKLVSAIVVCILCAKAILQYAGLPHSEGVDVAIAVLCFDAWGISFLRVATVTKKALSLR